MIGFEEQYLNIMRNILENGVDRPDRTGIGSRAVWHQSMLFDLAAGFPIITTRKVALRIAFEETWFFLRGETDTKKLEAKKIKIWNGNTSREFLDNRGLHYLPEGNIGKGYSFQWRNFGGDYKKTNKNKDGERIKGYICNYSKLDNSGVDQITKLLIGLKSNPNDRRHIVTAWNPQQLDESVLPPCHLYQQYQVLDGKLNSSFIARSQDFMYGTPYNVMGYALLNIVFAKYLGLQSGLLGYLGEDVHLYSNQIEMAKEQVSRTLNTLPNLNISKTLNTLDDILKLEYKDIELVEYTSWADFKNKPNMAI